MSKTYAIADMHGRADLLLRAAELIVKDCDGEPAPQVIILGDFVDRGPNAAKIIRMLRTMQQKAGWRVLQGNHEAIMLEVMRNQTPHKIEWWYRNGGHMTLRSYGYSNDELMTLPITLKPELESDLKWLATLPVWIGDKHRIFVHAGVPFDKEIGEVSNEMLQWMLYDEYGSEAHNEPELWTDFPHCSGKHIVHGHHQHMLNPVRHLKHRTNLDSFAWYTGRLAIGVFEDDTPGGPVKVIDAIGLPHISR